MGMLKVPFMSARAMRAEPTAIWVILISTDCATSFATAIPSNWDS